MRHMHREKVTRDAIDQMGVHLVFQETQSSLLVRMATYHRFSAEASYLECPSMTVCTTATPLL
jgi:hypothetical protein